MDLKQAIEIARIYLASMWRYRWAALAVSWTVALAIWSGIYLLPHNYRAEAQIFVDTENILRPLLGDLSVETDVQRELEVVTRAMLSRAHLERAIRAADLDIYADSQAEFDALVRDLEQRISIVPSRGNLYTIGFTDNDPETATSIVSELLDTFVESTLGSDLKDSRQAEATLRSQLDDYETRMLEAENRLEQFKRENVAFLGTQNANYYQQLQQAIGEQQEARKKVRVAERKRGELLRQLEGEEPVFGIMAEGFDNSAGGTTPYDQQIAALEKRIAELLVEYTENHPEVVRSLEMLEDLESKQIEHLAQAPMTAPINPITRSLDLNPIYQNIRIQLTNTETDLASLRAELSEKNAEVERLQKLVDVIPQVEAELSRLNRDYDVVKRRYEQMLNKWETLQTGQRVRSETGQFQFRVIDPPYASETPVGPPKVLFAVAGWVVAVGAGIGLALVLAIIWPVYSRVSQFSDLSVPVLGAIATVSSNSEASAARKGNVLYTFSLLALIALAVFYVGALQTGLLERLG